MSEPVKKPLDQFEVVESASRAYKFVWFHRALCFRYGALAYFSKLACYAAVIFLGFERDILKQGLILLPGFFAEGVAVCFLVQMAIHMSKTQGELHDVRGRYPSPQAVFDKNTIIAGAIIYVLIQMIFMISLNFITGVEGFAQSMGDREPGPEAFFLVLANFALLGAVIWAVRLSWLYVPVCLGFRMTRYLKRFYPFMTSIYMLGITLLCTVPIGVILMIVVQFLVNLLPGSMENPSMILSLTKTTFEVFAQIVTTLLASVAMAFAIYPGLSGQKP